jgi:outer membrane receptor protein involved in Fe transport
VKLQAYASRYKLRLWSDFTFFKASGLRFIQLPNGTVIDTGNGPVRPGARYVPGDGIYQGDSRWLAGGRGSYTRTWFLSDIPMQSEVGTEMRNDTADVTLQRQVRRQSFSRVNDVRIEETSFSGYVTQQIFPAEWVRFEAGFRGDYFLFNVNDRLPAQRPDPNFSSQLIDGRAGDGVLSPKANLVFSPLLNTDIYLNFGQGFHSNDARAVVLGKNFDPGTTGGVSPSAVGGLAKSLGYELGARTRQLDDKLDIAAALWLIDLDSELVFSGDAGSDEASPQTRRWGIDFETRYQILRWLSVDYDLSYADPRFRGAGAIAEAGGSAIPLAPTLYMNGGITAELPYGFSVGLRGRYLDDRPANEDRTLVARGFFLLDLVGRYRWRNVELSLQMLNLTNTDWREAQFADNSCVRSEQQGVNPGRPCFNKPGRNAVEPPADIHFTPGNPFGVYAGLKVFF